MTAVKEGRQQLAFDSAWRVVKWDEAQEFKGAMETAFHQLSGRSVKAVDVVAIRRTRGVTTVHLVAEFKDFDPPTASAGQRAAAARQALTSEMTRDIVAKVVDSLCGAAFSHDQANSRGAELQAWRSALSLKTAALLVLVCVELPPARKLAVVPWTTELKRRLRWLGPRAHVVVTSSINPYQGNGITYSLHP